MNKLKLIIVAVILVEIFLFKGEHFTSICMWAGELLGKILSNSIMQNY